MFLMQKLLILHLQQLTPGSTREEIESSYVSASTVHCTMRQKKSDYSFTVPKCYLFTTQLHNWGRNKGKGRGERETDYCRQRRWICSEDTQMRSDTVTCQHQTSPSLLQQARNQDKSSLFSIFSVSPSLSFKHKHIHTCTAVCQRQNEFSIKVMLSLHCQLGKQEYRKKEVWIVCS